MLSQVRSCDFSDYLLVSYICHAAFIDLARKSNIAFFSEASCRFIYYHTEQWFDTYGVKKLIQTSFIFIILLLIQWHHPLKYSVL